MAEPTSTAPAADLERVLLQQLVDGFAAGDPLMLELLMAACLPRSFDAATLAAMLDRSPQDAELQATLGRLTAHSLVEERANGQFALHDLLRKAIGSRWQSAELAGQRRLMLERLQRYYASGYRAASAAASALAEVGGLMRQVRPERYLAGVVRIEERLVRTAVNTVVVAVQLDIETGLRQFAEIFDEQAVCRRFRVCDLLLTGYAEAAGLVAEPDRDRQRGWATYFAARLAIYRRDWHAAQRQLDGIPPELFADLRFQSWVTMARADLLRGWCRFAEAAGQMEQVVKLNDQHHRDDYNAGLAWMTLADIHAQLWDVEAEVGDRRLAVAAAERYGNLPVALQGRTELAKALRIAGEPAAAAGELMLAMRDARVRLSEDLDANRWFSTGALTILGGRSRRLFATLAEQSRQLSGQSWPHGELDQLMAIAPILRSAGDFSGALEAYAKARKLAEEHLPDRVWEVESDWAGAAGELGEPLSGAEINLRILADPVLADDPWTVARCLSNAGDLFLRAGRFDQALDCLTRARQKWLEMDHQRASTVVLATTAEAWRRKGELARACGIFEEVKVESAYGYEAAVQLYRSRMLLDLLRSEEAVRDARAAALSLQTQGDRLNAMTAWTHAVQCLVESPSSAELAELAERLHRTAEERAGYCAWTPTTTTELADAHAGRALRIMVDGRGNLAARRRAAREHLDYAIELDDGNGWLYLERAFVNLTDSRPRDAARDFKLAADKIADPSLSAAILAISNDPEASSLVVPG